MSTDTEKARNWIEGRVRENIDFAREQGYSPIYAADGTLNDPVHILDICRIYRIMKAVNRMNFGSFVDVGGGFGSSAYLIRRLFDVPGYTSDMCHDLNLGAAKTYQVRSVSLDACRLPFASSSFDLVLCSEVLEHLEHPFQTLLELLRVAGKYLILTTQEICLSARARDKWLKSVDYSRPHAERNFFLPEELQCLLGDDVVCSNLAHLPELIFEESIRSRADFKDIVLRLTAAPELTAGSFGIILIKCHADALLSDSGRLEEEEILDTILREDFDFDRKLQTFFESGGETASSTSAFASAAPSSIAQPRKEISPELQSFDPAMSSFLRCPDCRDTLTHSKGKLTCDGCGETFEVDLGTPIMYPKRPIAMSEGEVEEEFGRLYPSDPARLGEIKALYRRITYNRPATSRFARALIRADLKLRRFFELPLPPLKKLKLGTRWLLDSLR